MKRKRYQILIGGIMAAALLACSVPAGAEEAAGSGSAAGRTFAIVTKSIGNPYNMREAEGFKEVIEAEGGTCVVSH